MHSPALSRWLETTMGNSFDLTPIIGDASFRQYYRLMQEQRSYIVMNAPPDKESLADFIKINALLDTAGVYTPKIYHSCLIQGFAVLEDLGNQLLLEILTPANADYYYQSAIDTILAIQQCKMNTPVFNSALINQELNLFRHWFLDAFLQMNLTPSQMTLIDSTLLYLITEIIRQPYVLVHRDYHSRNLMVNPNHPHSLAVIDFQDAVNGPITYDLVSLLKDCYISWPRTKILQWLDYFYQRSNTAQQINLADFIRFFDLTGLQRHLKVLGIFCRLHLRDRKSNYLNSLPLTLSYTLDCLATYPEFEKFHQLMSEIILP